VLPPAEWPRLKGTELESVWPHLHADRATVLVVECDGHIVATWMLVTIVHAEGLWIAPAFRKRTSVARRLWLAMRRAVRERGVLTIATSAVTDEVRELLDHAGAVKLPGDHYSMRVL
jgi:hypothetical protein